jgi:hypothetical protein
MAWCSVKESTGKLYLYLTLAFFRLSEKNVNCVLKQVIDPFPTLSNSGPKIEVKFLIRHKIYASDKASVVNNVNCHHTREQSSCNIRRGRYLEGEVLPASQIHSTAERWNNGRKDESQYRRLKTSRQVVRSHIVVVQSV